MSSPMIPEQRQKELLRLLRTAGVLSIRDLTELMKVSHMTIRRDISNLEEGGQVVAVQGGVRLAEHPGVEPPAERSSRAQLELPRKRAIAERAATLVEDGMVVFLDAGTTCESVVPFLAARRNVTVVTNDYGTVAALFDYPEIETIHTGGAVDVESRSSSGPLAAATLASVNLDLCFLSTGTWDVPHGVTTPSTEKVVLKRAAMASASTSVLLADSTKFGTFERFNVVPLAKLDAVVTDSDLSETTRRALRDLGVDLDIAEL
ncbi:DeoR/GlpR family DNA-binding transcription regulator [Sinomonas sp. ASV322]|uniref:DeoR/GlpR family DNA-binding transcription regulator n=1 Tax=Sinomonas sp. ASV322 TaxID=3041920 RepID=UPI0027DDDAA8|nr:DeoR/GlpR family DNA-binding transcription regulator [Sinomonas sp. ASV322]MDQ4503571.1 DeoR/GlpR family DNA-binding transcription regulator [Sinomonas sp. ASV322]